MPTDAELFKDFIDGGWDTMMTFAEYKERQYNWRRSRPTKRNRKFDPQNRDYGRKKGRNRETD